jgi:DNA repair exonuclease SbcCD ATPase subunit
MPDTTVEPGGSGPYDRPLEPRVSRLEEQMSDLKPILARIEAVLPHLATAAQVAELKGDLERKFADFAGTMELKHAQFAGSVESKLAQFAGALELSQAQFAGSLESKVAQFAGAQEAKLAQFAGAQESKLAQFAGSLESRQVQFAGDFNAKLERLTGRVESLPTTWQMITAIIAGQITFAGVLCAVVFGAARLYGHL